LQTTQLESTTIIIICVTAPTFSAFVILFALSAYAPACVFSPPPQLGIISLIFAQRRAPAHYHVLLLDADKASFPGIIQRFGKVCTGVFA